MKHRAQPPQLISTNITKPEIVSLLGFIKKINDRLKFKIVVIFWRPLYVKRLVPTETKQTRKQRYIYILYIYCIVYIYRDDLID